MRPESTIMIMDTSKGYYESFMRDFRMYCRGRTPEQFCRDEGADFKWIGKAMNLYGEPSSSKSKTDKADRKTKAKPTDMIRLHFDPEGDEPTACSETASATDAVSPQGTEPVAGQEWKVAGLTMITPGGHKIEIRTSNPSAVSELLAKLTA